MVEKTTKSFKLFMKSFFLFLEEWDKWKKVCEEELEPLIRMQKNSISKVPLQGGSNFRRVVLDETLENRG